MKPNTGSGAGAADEGRTLLGRRAFVLGAAAVGFGWLASCRSDGLGGGRGQDPARLGVPPARAARPSLPPSALPSPPPALAQATAAPALRRPLAVLPRSAWTSRELGLNHDPMTAIERITLHHTGSDHGGIDDLVAMQRIEHWHRDCLGWAGIGYHFVVGHDGRVIEGRPLAAQGAHVRDRNSGNIGIAVLGCYDASAPAAGQLETLRRLLDELRLRHAIPASELHGHRELAATSCPGDRLYDWLCAYRKSKS